MVALAGLFVLGLGAGCGPADDGSNGAGTPADDAAPAAAGDQPATGDCPMATAEEVEQATGVTFTLTYGGELKCEFKSADGLLLMYAKVEDDASRYQTLHTITAEQIVDVPAVGDKAFYAPEIPNVTVGKGDDVVTINLFAEPPSGKFKGDTKAKLVELGRSAADHM
jgi:hypothetical protein